MDRPDAASLASALRAVLEAFPEDARPPDEIAVGGRWFDEAGAAYLKAILAASPDAEWVSALDVTAWDLGLPTWHVMSLCALTLLVVPLSAMRLRDRAEANMAGAVAGASPGSYGRRSTFLPVFMAAYALLMWLQPHRYFSATDVGLGAAALIVFAFGAGVASVYIVVSPPARPFAGHLFALLAVIHTLALLLIGLGARTGLIHRPAFKPLLFAVIAATAWTGTAVPLDRNRRST